MRTEFDPLYANSFMIMSGFALPLMPFSEPLDQIMTTSGPWGILIPLPFACRKNSGMQIMWYKGDNALQMKLH